jgi:hypothetical protein
MSETALSASFGRELVIAPNGRLELSAIVMELCLSLASSAKRTQAVKYSKP